MSDRKTEVKKVDDEDEEDLDDDDRLMIEEMKKNEQAHKCGNFKQSKVFFDEK